MNVHPRLPHAASPHSQHTYIHRLAFSIDTSLGQASASSLAHLADQCRSKVVDFFFRSAGDKGTYSFAALSKLTVQALPLRWTNPYSGGQPDDAPEFGGSGQVGASWAQKANWSFVAFPVG